jgi:N-acetylglucosaminyldiphosphoundecaprenol N-acetyl-beta-D-mannosaminyltransferase
MSVFVLPDPDTVTLGGLRFAALTEGEVVHRVRTALAHGIGGRIVTPNVDILRQVGGDPAVRADLETADLIVADGTPLVWASRLAGTPLPERVTGSGLIWSLSAGLAADGASVYLLGGAASGPACGAERAASVLLGSYPGLRVAGAASPPFGFEESPASLQRVLAAVIDAEPDLVFVGLGFPKQERIVEVLRPALPATWFLGCGAAINFVAGDRSRAPAWMQRTGLEWAHRLACEPRRLARRYLCRDAPYAAWLLAEAALRRRERAGHADEWGEVIASPGTASARAGAAGRAGIAGVTADAAAPGPGAAGAGVGPGAAGAGVGPGAAGVAGPARGAAGRSAAPAGGADMPDIVRNSGRFTARSSVGGDTGPGPERNTGRHRARPGPRPSPR